MAQLDAWDNLAAIHRNHGTAVALALQALGRAERCPLMAFYAKWANVDSVKHLPKFDVSNPQIFLDGRMLPIAIIKGRWPLMTWKDGMLPAALQETLIKSLEQFTDMSKGEVAKIVTAVGNIIEMMRYRPGIAHALRDGNINWNAADDDPHPDLDALEEALRPQMDVVDDVAYHYLNSQVEVAKQEDGLGTALRRLEDGKWPLHMANTLVHFRKAVTTELGKAGGRRGRSGSFDDLSSASDDHKPTRKKHRKQTRKPQSGEIKCDKCSVYVKKSRLSRHLKVCPMKDKK